MKDRALRTFFSLLWVAILGVLFYFEPILWKEGLSIIEKRIYDLQVRRTFKPLKDSPVVIVDIDNTSLQEKGKWPWTRVQMGKLVAKLYEAGVTVVAFDLLFSDIDENPVDEILTKTPTSELSRELEELRSSFDGDKYFAKELKQGEAVLGFIFKKEGTHQGPPPKPIITLAESLQKELLIPNWPSYISNLQPLQSAAKGEGFLNSTPDIDGINRFVPIILRMGDKIYPSLALEAVRLFLLIEEKPFLILAEYGGRKGLEGIQMGPLVIPTNGRGEVLVPFHGPPYSLPYISAADVLNEKIDLGLLANKIVFVGSTAAAIGDLKATPISPIFPGVEIQGNIAAGIIRQSLPSAPPWGKGAATLLLFLLGVVGSFIFPRLGPIPSSLLFVSVNMIVLTVNAWVWNRYAFSFAIGFPIFVWTLLYILNLIGGYFFERRKTIYLKEIFSQYLPKERIELLAKKNMKELGLEGENKELTVLFSDIRGFTKISEGIPPSKVKQFLNEFLTPMTQIIFDFQGTVDKYEGDLIMAFWGAPVEDHDHSVHAVQCGWKMQKKLEELNQSSFKEAGLKGPIQIGIGINTGMMNVGDMGSKFRRAYTVLGDSVNLSSRLQDLTKIYGSKILLGPKTKEEAKTHFLFEQIDRIKVKGREEVIDLFEPICKVKEENEEMKKRLMLNHEAFNAYFQKDWSKAKELFENFKKSFPESEKRINLLLERIAEYEKSPPPDDWKGVYTHETKS